MKMSRVIFDCPQMFIDSPLISELVEKLSVFVTALYPNSSAFEVPPFLLRLKNFISFGFKSDEEGLFLRLNRTIRDLL
jgi:hypothetical protein